MVAASAVLMLTLSAAKAVPASSSDSSERTRMLADDFMTCLRGDGFGFRSSRPPHLQRRAGEGQSRASHAPHSIAAVLRSQAGGSRCAR